MYQSGPNVNKTLLWMSLKLTGQLFNSKFDLLKILLLIVDKIRDIIQFTDYSNDLKFKKKFEIASLMIKTVKSIYPKLKSRGINDPLVNNIEDRIVTWEFLIENISNNLN